MALEKSPEIIAIIAKTHAEVAAFFNVSVRCVENWSSSGMPGKQGAYDLSRVTFWLYHVGPRRSDAAIRELVADIAEGRLIVEKISR